MHYLLPMNWLAVVIWGFLLYGLSCGLIIRYKRWQVRRLDRRMDEKMRLSFRENINQLICEMTDRADEETSFWMLREALRASIQSYRTFS